jgi:hypothetical protein
MFLLKPLVLKFLHSRMDKLPKDLDWMFGNYMEFFEKFDMTKQNILSVFYQWKTENSGGVKEYLWDILEKLLYEAEQISSEITSYKVQLLIYKERWNYKVEVKGENGNKYYRKYLYCGLKLYQLYEQQTIRIASGSCCPFCDALNQQRVRIEDSLKRQPLASLYCTNELCCNCLYLS